MCFTLFATATAIEPILLGTDYCDVIEIALPRCRFMDNSFNKTDTGLLIRNNR